MWLLEVLLCKATDIFNSVADIFDHVTLTPGHQSQVLITYFRKPEELLAISHQSLVHTTAHKVVFSLSITCEDGPKLPQ